MGNVFIADLVQLIIIIFNSHLRLCSQKDLYLAHIIACTNFFAPIVGMSSIYLINAIC